jgi:hypothetical protein
MEYDIIKHACLLDKHVSTLKTIHRSNGKIIEKPYELQIVRYFNDEGVYLLYLNAQGEELTDTSTLVKKL